MAGRRLPIGIRTFQKIREDNCYYVDKTAYIQRLVDGGTHYFLSRPRRFGKSLFLDTLKELFEGNEPLFRDLEIHDRWDWSARHPVLRGLYATIKDHDAQVRFTFLTGVSRNPQRGCARGNPATPSPTWTRSSRPSFPAWIGQRSATGTTAMAGWARNGSQPLRHPSCCSTGAGSRPTGSRPARRSSWSKRCANGR